MSGNIGMSLDFSEVHSQENQQDSIHREDEDSAQKFHIEGTPEDMPGELHIEGTQEVMSEEFHIEGTQEAMPEEFHIEGTQEAMPEKFHIEGTQEAMPEKFHIEGTQEAMPEEFHIEGTERAVLEEDVNTFSVEAQPDTEMVNFAQDTEVDFESSAVFENTEANDEQDFVDTASSNNSATSNDHTAETETTESSSNTRKPPFAPVVSASQKPAASANSKRPFTPLKRMDQLKPTGEPAPAAVGTTAAAKRANVPPPFAKRGATTSASGPLSQTGAVAQQHQPPPFAKPQSQKRDPVKPDSNKPQPTRTLKCQMCNVFSNNEYQMNLHLNGRPHRERLEKEKTKSLSQAKKPQRKRGGYAMDPDARNKRLFDQSEHGKVFQDDAANPNKMPVGNQGLGARLFGGRPGSMPPPDRNLTPGRGRGAQFPRQEVPGFGRGRQVPHEMHGNAKIPPFRAPNPGQDHFGTRPTFGQQRGVEPGFDGMNSMPDQYNFSNDINTYNQGNQQQRQTGPPGFGNPRELEREPYPVDYGYERPPTGYAAEMGRATAHKTDRDQVLGKPPAPIKLHPEAPYSDLNGFYPAEETWLPEGGFLVRRRHPATAPNFGAPLPLAPRPLPFAEPPMRPSQVEVYENVRPHPQTAAPFRRTEPLMQRPPVGRPEEYVFSEPPRPAVVMHEQRPAAGRRPFRPAVPVARKEFPPPPPMGVRQQVVVIRRTVPVMAARDPLERDPYARPPPEVNTAFGYPRF